MKRLFVPSVAAVLACVALNAQAAPTLSANLDQRLPEPYVNEVIKATPALPLSILGLLGEKEQLASWITQGFRSGNLVVTPIKSFESGKTVITGTFCKPHDCGDTLWYFAYEPQSQALLLQQGNQAPLTNTQAKTTADQLQKIVDMSKTLDSMTW